MLQQGLPSQEDAFAVVGVHVGEFRGLVHLAWRLGPILFAFFTTTINELLPFSTPLFSEVTSRHTVTSLLSSLKGCHYCKQRLHLPTLYQLLSSPLLPASQIFLLE